MKFAMVYWLEEVQRPFLKYERYMFNVQCSTMILGIECILFTLLFSYWLFIELELFNVSKNVASNEEC